MDYKEKYEQALERARQFSEKPYLEDSAGIVEYIFPELKESEDEKTKRILHSISSKMSFHLRDIFTEEEFQCFDTWSNAWLEKQKPAKTPQWMIEFLDDHRRHFGSPMEHEERRDVDGKLLCIKKWLEGNCVEQKPTEWSTNDEFAIKILNTVCDEYLRISTYKGTESRHEVIDAKTWLKSLKGRVQPKPAEWSEEDEKVTKWVIDYIGNCPNESFDFYGGVGKEAVLSWLNKLKDILLLQPKQEWREEDEKMLEELLNYCDTSIQYNGIKSPQAIKWKKRKEWFKSLRPQKQDVMSVDEFRHVVGYLVQDIVANEHMAETEKQPTNFFVEKYYNKLSSQSHWKPSDEQIEAVRLAAEIGTANNSWAMGILKGMYQDLKKLREE